MKLTYAALCAFILAGCMHGPHGTGGAHGMTRIASANDVKTTIDRFEAAAKSRGLMIFNRIDHAGGAQQQRPDAGYRRADNRYTHRQWRTGDQYRNDKREPGDHRYRRRRAYRHRQQC